MSDFVDQPREPLRPVVDTPTRLATCLAALEAATGPVCFDAERAHGFRYHPRAYLFQIRREGAGTWLIDPIAFQHDGETDLSAVAEACGEAEWIIHAASQDLPCMSEDNILPTRLFDTELAARLLGEPAVSLGALLEKRVGIRLRKAHSAANWATRPLPENWLTYAALDVDYLAELADSLRADLLSTGRMPWAEQEFAHELDQFSAPARVRRDPWRRLSGITSLRSPRELAVARALWEERDRIARHRDRPSSHILGDAAIVELAATARPDRPLPNEAALGRIQGFRSRGAQRYRANWLRAVASVEQLPPSKYPPRRPPSEGIPHPRNWPRSNPQAAALWGPVRSEVDELACDLGLQPSLLAPPAILQRVVHDHAQIDDFSSALRDQGARPWQVEFLAPLLDEAAGRA